MSLDVANNVARQALLAAQYEISLAGRNIAAAGDPDRSRAMTALTTTVDGGVRIAEVRRAEDRAVYDRMIEATAVSAERSTVLGHLEDLSQLVGDPENGTSVAALIGDLEEAVAEYANAPDDPLFGRTVVARAHDVANKLNRSASELLLLREKADAEMAASVDVVNELLVEFDEVNKAIIKGTVTDRDITMDLDRRDAIIADISEHLGVTMLRRDNNDIALYTDGGVTLYDRELRTLTFSPTPVFGVGTTGSAVFVDGLAITGPDSSMPSTTGSIVGNALVRDQITGTYELQMDEIARELEDIFADGPGSLFVTSGGPDYAGSIQVAAAVDPAQGGTVTNLRDGTGNPAGSAAYSDRLFALGVALNTPTPFDPTAELSATASLMDFTTESVGWVEGLRQSTQRQSIAEEAIRQQVADTFSRTTGVNLDDEYARQLMIERSFAASSQLIGAIDEMFDTLLRMV